MNEHLCEKTDNVHVPTKFHQSEHTPGLGLPVIKKPILIYRFTYETGTEFTIWVSDTDLFFAHISPVVQTVIYANHINRGKL